MELLKTVAFYAIPSVELAEIKKSMGIHASIVSYDNPLTAENICPNADVIVILPSTTIDDELVSKMPRLKTILTMSAGTEHIQLSDENHKKVGVLNNPTFSIESVSEYIVACVFKAYKSSHWTIPVLPADEVAGKKALIIGYGNIGKMLTRKLDALGVSILVLTSAPLQETSNVKKVVSLSDSIAQADIICLITSLRPDTAKIINASALASAREDAVLINAARGGLIDNDALLADLNRGKLRAVFLDDIAPAESKTAKALLSHERVTYTPHVAWSTSEASERRISYTSSRLLELL